MTLRLFLSLTGSFCLPLFGLAAQTPAVASVLKPGRYLLVLPGSAEGTAAPDPILMLVKSAPGGVLTVEPEKAPAGAAALQPERNALVFSLKLPGHDGIPPKGQDWYVSHLLSCAGTVGRRVPNMMEGVFSDIGVFYHPESRMPGIFTGTFLLYTDWNTAPRSGRANW